MRREQRAAVRFLVLSLILSSGTFSGCGGVDRREYAGRGGGEPREPVIIDADTGNEIGDLFAVVRALVEPSFRVRGLTSSHWTGGSSAPASTVEESQRQNERLLELLELRSIPHPRGAAEPLEDASTPRESDAARHIVETALDIHPAGKLTVIATGPLTNVASAVLMDSRVARRLRCYVTALQFDDRTGEWRKEDFNTAADPIAVEVLLRAEDLELHVLPATVAEELLFRKSVVESNLRGKGGVWDYLADQWEERQPRNRWWVMWDVALVERAVEPDVALEVRAPAPVEGNGRSIRVITEIDRARIKRNFWRALTLHRFKLPST